MTTLQAVDALAEQRDDLDQLPAHLRDLDRLPALLNARELAALRRISVSQFYKLAKRGTFDFLKVSPVTGPNCYSGLLVSRWLKGEPVYLPTFGRRKRA